MSLKRVVVSNFRECSSKTVDKKGRRKGSAKRDVKKHRPKELCKVIVKKVGRKGLSNRLDEKVR